MKKSLAFRLKTGIILLILCFLMILWPGLYRKNNELYTDMQMYATADIFYVNGRTKSVSGTEFGMISRGDRIELSVCLPEELKADPGTLVFSTDCAVGEVFWRGRCLESYGMEIAESGGMVCHHNYFVTIPSEAWGSSIDIFLTVTEDRAFNRLPRLWLYPAEKAYSYYFDFQPRRLVIAMTILPSSLVILIAVAVMYGFAKIRNRELLCAAAFGLISSVWMILSEGLQGIFGFDGYFLTTLEYVCLPLQTIPLMGFTKLESTRQDMKTLINGLVVEDSLFIAAFCLLNYLTDCHFSRMMPSMAVLITINGIVLLISGILHLKEKARSKRLAFIAIMILSLAGLFDLARYSLYSVTGSPVFGNTQGTFVTGILIFYVLMLLSAIEKVSETQEAERQSRNKLLTSQIQPHFIYNTLATIQEIIFEDQETAAGIVSDFAVYLRGATRSMSEIETISFSEELKHIRAYLKIEKVRFAGRLETVFEIGPSEFQVPPLSLQVFVENAVKHGIFARGKLGGTVRIISEETGQAYRIRVEDDGNGFDVEQTMKDIQSGTGTSAGMINAVSRLEEIVKAKIEIDSRIGEGTTVTVTIPKR